MNRLGLFPLEHWLIDDFGGLNIFSRQESLKLEGIGSSERRGVKFIQRLVVIWYKMPEVAMEADIIIMFRRHLVCTR